jgi:septal ring factor EnvC (AmiA/AmiB activator)
MSETSRTDRAAEDNRYHECLRSACCVSVDFARQFERELKDAREIAAKYEDRYFETKDHRDRLKYEREFFQSAFIEQGDVLSKVIEQRDRLAEVLDALKQSILDLSHPNMKLLLEERNEAREQRDRLAVALDVCLREMLDVIYACNEEIVDANDTFHQAIKLGQKTLDDVKGGSDE